MKDEAYDAPHDSTNMYQPSVDPAPILQSFFSPRREAARPHSTKLLQPPAFGDADRGTDEGETRRRRSRRYCASIGGRVTCFWIRRTARRLSLSRSGKAGGRGRGADGSRCRVIRKRGIKTLRSAADSTIQPPLKLRRSTKKKRPYRNVEAVRGVDDGRNGGSRLSLSWTLIDVDGMVHT